MQFTTIDRKITLKDVLTVTDIFKVGDIIKVGSEEFEFSPADVRSIERLPPLVYVDTISKDENYVIVKHKKRSKTKSTKLPVNIFKVVLVPKMKDVIEWLFDNQPVVRPIHWSVFTDEINTISRYLVKIFQKNLKVIHLINKYINHLYFKNDPIDILVFYKTIVKNNNLYKSDIWQNWEEWPIKDKFVKEILRRNSEWNELDARSLWVLINNQTIKVDVSKESLMIGASKTPRRCLAHIWFNEIMDPKADIFKNSKVPNKERDEILKKIQEINKADQASKLQNDRRFIKELSQEIIDKLELTLFNVKTLHNTNQVLYIFIDKDNNKRFYIKDFEFEFYISSNIKLIDNDYIVPLDKSTHQKYMVKDLGLLRNLKFAVNDNHKRFMKIGEF